MRNRMSSLALLALLVTSFATPALAAWRVVGWSELGMHCMDGDFSVFSILPPYNTIHAQVIDGNGRLVKSNSGITVTYEAVADATGSINTTSIGKTNFWSYSQALFGATPAVDKGLVGFGMPGAANTPQAMAFDATRAFFTAEGIPITPTDDGGKMNSLPLMKIVVRDTAGTLLASTVISLPVSAEIDCVRCHASNSNSAAKPPSGWVNDPSRERDTRLNILRIHDDFNTGRSAYIAALATAGYKPEGLFATATGGTPILCARCHASAALGAAGVAGLPSMTSAMHRGHTSVSDPKSGEVLGNATTRDACYACHPGGETRCLRDAMGSAGTPTGDYSMHCQACHGSMGDVGVSSRRGWLDEPTCGACHTGTETSNSGQLRYTTVFDAPGHVRVPASTTFQTNANTPVTGSSLFRMSTGHGGLFCPACHGAPHAVAPSRSDSDNLQAISAGGAAGVIGECSACHPTVPSTTTGGPHGLHPVGQAWISGHKNPGESESNCRPCHGTTDRGGPLSATVRDRSFSSFGQKNWWRGSRIGCYSCHSGPNSENGSNNGAPSITGTTLQTRTGASASATLTATDPNNDALTLRVVRNPKHGSAGFEGKLLTYVPDPGFAGSDDFTVAARDSYADSNLATVTVSVVGTERRRPARR